MEKKKTCYWLKLCCFAFKPGPVQTVCTVGLSLNEVSFVSHVLSVVLNSSTQVLLDSISVCDEPQSAKSENYCNIFLYVLFCLEAPANPQMWGRVVDERPSGDTTGWHIVWDEKTYGAI